MKNSLSRKVKKTKKEGCDTMNRMNIGRKLAILLMVLCMVVPLLTGTAAADTVVPSGEEYTLSFSGVEEVFFGNATKANIKAGKDVYLTYTVDRVRTDHKAVQHGVLGTSRPETRYPYDKGGVLCYSDDAPIMEQGYTYFFKFSYNEETGFEYVAARAKNGTSQWVWFDSRVGDETDNYSYYGIWLAGGIVSVRLTTFAAMTKMEMTWEFMLRSTEIRFWTKRLCEAPMMNWIISIASRWTMLPMLWSVTQSKPALMLCIWNIP